MQNVASHKNLLITTFLINYRYIVKPKSKKKAEFGIIKKNHDYMALLDLFTLLS